MQLKSLSLLAGAIALTLTTTTTSLAMPMLANASSPQLIAQAEKKGPWESLGLTDDQKAKIKEIQRNTRTQMQAVFTPEQKAKLEAARQARQQGQRPPVGERPGKKFADLNLTDDQKAKLRAIRESSQKQIEALLTPEQRTKLQELKANARQRWQQRRQQPGEP
ncbi:Spy/CpxP family protein refolding chaperone [Nostoc sp. TCL26-01]|uniref:Spy/CpxP family protein refolding chaperone n=1 Tax=Nostoc sp. TCL26-01 TaxID=2576904 RepID=UPI0015B83A63|nr:P pilus assembly/Cpx signaling pathway, periplasmic inhibitor/zinc-resistance associated protein [Nostoc sp. TCL26-01]QLE54718.1 P pilus assembly/Cpx signaling pathway, periplasmic inhibitor/zinc-resistance associated protein [Nostoc sp. TCL26-01]